MAPITDNQLLFLALFASATTLAAAPDSTNAPAQLPAVIVTAQKEPAAPQSLPVSVTPVTRATIEAADIQTVKEASIYAPDTFINEFTARAVSNPFFRGIGGSPLNPGVTTFIDGVPQLNGYSSSIELVDVDQVEFVRGPQGALFGRNTAGGLINITSRRPTDLWTASAEGSYGNYDFRDARGAVSGPLVPDSLALGLAGGYSARDGYTRNDFTGHNLDRREAGFGKGQLLFKESDRFELRLIVSGEHDDDGDYALGDLAGIRANPHHVSRDFEGFNHRDVAAATLLANYSGETVDLASISGGVWWKNEGLTDLDYTPAPGNTRDNVEEQHQFTQELRLSSAKDSPVKLGDALDLGWQSGVFVFSQDYQQHVVNNALVPLPPPNPPVPVNNTTTADLDDWGVGLYGQMKLTAWSKLDLSAGLRFDYEDKQANLGSVTAPAGFGAQSLLNRADNFSEVSPQFSVAYRFTSNQTAYASAARGFKAGGFNQTSPAGSEEYHTEHSWNYEVGHKSEWFDGKLETTAALFYIDWRSLQLNQPVPGGGGSFYIANAGNAASKGVEFEVKYRPLSHWDLFGSVGYSGAKFLSGSSSLGANVGGNRLPFTPAFTGNMGTEVSWAPCRAATLYARAEVTVYGDFEYDPSNAQSQQTYSLANFRAGVRGGHWFAEGWVNNVFDTQYVPIAIPYNTPSGYVGESGAPVTFGVRAGLVF
jgi:iron complex outermembrane recepter protein